MPRNLRSFIAQCYKRGERWTGSRRKVCSKPASSNDPNGVGSISSKPASISESDLDAQILFWFITRGIGTAVGYTIGTSFFSRFIPGYEESVQEGKKKNKIKK